MTDTTTTTREQMMLENGWASHGTLARVKATGKLVKITGSTRMKYKMMDQDGRDLVIVFRGLELAEDAVWTGPDKSRNELARERYAEKADEWKVGDTVTLTNPKDAARFPGNYMIVKRTSATRFKFLGIGTGIEFTGPATGLRKV